MEYEGFKNYWKEFKDRKSYKPNKTTILVNNLTPMTNYTFRVFATTVCGVDSPKSNTITVTTAIQRKYINVSVA
jgi:hypothetical protein